MGGRFAYSAAQGGRMNVRSALAVLASLSFAACAGTGSSSPGGTGGARGPAGTGGAGTGGRGAGGTTPDGGSDVPVAGTGGGVGPAGTGGAVIPSGTGGAAGGGSGGATTPSDGGAADRACQMAEYTFAPKLPTVYLLVDRSGSMFACVGATDAQAPPCADHAMSYWARLQTSMLAVVRALDSQVRFGFATFNGTAGGTCPDVKKVAPAVGNSAAIAALYDGLPFRGNSDKWETPTRRTLEMIGAELAAIPDPGDKYILLVTDGEPDYCGDGNLLCPPDAVVAELQALKKDQAITTIVFGLQSAVGDIPPTVLQAFFTRDFHYQKKGPHPCVPPSSFPPPVRRSAALIVARSTTFPRRRSPVTRSGPPWSAPGSTAPKSMTSCSAARCSRVIRPATLRAPRCSAPGCRSAWRACRSTGNARRG